jgi:transcriptional regulator with XRE-family HTH domain
MTINDKCNEIISELVRIRQEKGLTPQQLSELSGVNIASITQIETGETNPSISTLIKLLVPLGKTLAVVPLNDYK